MAPEKIPHVSASLSGRVLAGDLVKVHLTAGQGSGQSIIVRPGLIREMIRALEMMVSGQAIAAEVGTYTQGKARIIVPGDGKPLITD
jgi:hypothetical protein